MKLTTKLCNWLSERYETFPQPRTDEEKRKAYSRQCARALLDEKLSREKFAELSDGLAIYGSQIDTDSTEDISTMAKNKTAEKLFGSDSESESPTRTRVKSPSEGLCQKRYTKTNEKLGIVPKNAFGQQAFEPSEYDYALAGCWFKKAASRCGQPIQLSEWEKQFLDDACENEQWASFAGDAHENKIFQGSQVKALLDDSTSGGMEVAPIAFDDMIISNLLLYGELMPMVNLVPVSRGRRIEGASVGHPSVQWGTGEGTAGSLYDFTDYVSSVDTSIFAAVCFMELGLDLMSDSPIDLGQVVVQKVGESYQKAMDDVIASGNGSTQPEGIVNKSGVTSVAFGNSTSLGNYESILFGVPKQYRKAAGNRFAFVGTETSYQRARGMPVSASDARRLWGMSHEDYTLFAPRKYLINESLTNRQIAGVDLSRYRLYQRLGFSVSSSKEGQSLMTKNTQLFAIRFRYGGVLTTPEACALTEDAPA